MCHVLIAKTRAVSSSKGRPLQRGAAHTFLCAAHLPDQGACKQIAAAADASLFVLLMDERRPDRPPAPALDLRRIVPGRVVGGGVDLRIIANPDVGAVDELPGKGRGMGRARREKRKG